MKRFVGPFGEGRIVQAFAIAAGAVALVAVGVGASASRYARDGEFSPLALFSPEAGPTNARARPFNAIDYATTGAIKDTGQVVVLAPCGPTQSSR